MGIIYSYTNNINGKKYIGQTINPRQRKYQHKSSAFNENDKSYDSILHRAFRKYGYDNFTYEVLTEANTIDELNKLEIYYIEKFNTVIPNGYNILIGGKNASHPFPEEQKEIKSFEYGKLTKEEVIELRKAYANKESPSQIYDEKYAGKMHYNSFLNIWAGQRYKTVMPEVFTEKYRHTKLNEGIVRTIRYKREIEHLTYSAISIQMNIPKSTIADVCTYKTWKNIKLEPVSTRDESVS